MAPDPAVVATVIEICGCSPEAAASAVEAAGPGGVELAVDLVLSTQSAHWASATDGVRPPTMATKVVCLVRQDLGMGVGKVAAQVSHAVMGAYKASARAESRREVLSQWEASGEATIVLAVSDHAELERLLGEARARGLNAHCVADAGRTEVAPGSHTVGAIGPDEVGKIDAVTGHLSLL
jgi:PTH2 family peptidyl-tRNA hydrolase